MKLNGATLNGGMLNGTSGIVIQYATVSMLIQPTETIFTGKPFYKVAIKAAWTIDTPVSFKETHKAAAKWPSITSGATSFIGYPVQDHAAHVDIAVGGASLFDEGIVNKIAGANWLAGSSTNMTVTFTTGNGGWYQIGNILDPNETLKHGGLSNWGTTTSSFTQDVRQPTVIHGPTGAWAGEVTAIIDPSIKLTGTTTWIHDQSILWQPATIVWSDVKNLVKLKTTLNLQSGSVIGITEIHKQAHRLFNVVDSSFNITGVKRRNGIINAINTSTLTADGTVRSLGITVYFATDTVNISKLQAYPKQRHAGKAATNVILGEADFVSSCTVKHGSTVSVIGSNATLIGTGIRYVMTTTDWIGECTTNVVPIRKKPVAGTWEPFGQLLLIAGIVSKDVAPSKRRFNASVTTRTFQASAGSDRILEAA